jgi:hypothetical protein
MQTMTIDISEKDIAGPGGNKDIVDKKEAAKTVSAGTVEPGKNINKLFGK